MVRAARRHFGRRGERFPRRSCTMSDSQPSVLSPTEGEKYRAGPFAISARVLGTQTGGAFEFYELALGAGGTIEYHVQHNMDENIYVLEGEVAFVVEKKKFPRPPGSVAFIPRGHHHGFANKGAGQARVTIIFNPSGNQHEYF